MIGYLGTVSLVALVAIGAYEQSAWLIVPIAIVNTFMGMHYPAEKAAIAKARGFYFRVLIGSFPIQLGFAALLYGIGRGIGWFFS